MPDPEYTLSNGDGTEVEEVGSPDYTVQVNLKLDGLSTATLAGTDIVPVQTGTSTPGKSTLTALFTFLWTLVAAATGKTTPVDADTLPITDSENANVVKSLTMANLWAWAQAKLTTYKLDDLATPDDNTDLNASASNHGLMRKLSGVATQMFTGDGSWTEFAVETDTTPTLGGELDAASNKVVNLGTPTASGDAASKNYVDSLLAGLRWKTPVRVASTANVTLASAAANGDTVDGVVIATGDRVLYKDQSDPIENGIYVTAASGAPTRATDMAAASSAASATVFVQEGSTNADGQYTCTDDVGSDVVGTDGLTLTQSGAGAVGSVFGRTGTVLAVAGDYDDTEVSAPASATNYTPSASTVRGHLAGIDTALASLGVSVWTEIAGAKYTATPTDTNTLAMSDTSDLVVGKPIYFTIGGTDYYAIVSVIVANTSIDIVGEPLSGSVTALYVGLSSQLVLYAVPTILGLYGDATTIDLLTTDLYYPVTETWKMGPAKCIGFDLVHGTDDGTSQPKVNVEIDGSPISSANTNAGPSVSTTRATTGVAVNIANTDVGYGSTIEMPVNTAGGDGDAVDLQATIFFVLK
jgi:hypothetical protein